MNDKSQSKKFKSAEPTQEWHPYAVWQEHIRDSKGSKDKADTNVTGSWRADAVWQNLIKD